MFSEYKILAQKLWKDFISNHKKSLIQSILLMIIVALTSSSYIWMIEKTLNTIFFQKNLTMLTLLPIIVATVICLKNLALYLQITIMQIAIAKMTNEMRTRLFSKFLNSDFKNLAGTASTAMLSKMTNHVSAISAGINTVLTGLIRELLTVLFVVIAMFIQNWKLSLISMIVLPFVAFALGKISKKLKKAAKQSFTNNEEFFVRADETIRSVKLIKAYCSESFESKRMNDILSFLFKNQKKVIRTASITSPLVEALSGIAVAVIIWYGGYQVISGQATPGSFFAFFVAFSVAYKPFKNISGIGLGMHSTIFAAKEYYEIIEMKSEIENDTGQIFDSKIKKGITFQNVQFKYPGLQTNALNKINLFFEVGKTTALVGSSGSGKSTVANLLLRLYDSTSGEIFLDDSKYKNLNIKSIRSKFAFVGQDIQLFDDTVESNVKYLNTNATDEDIKNACIAAHADEFIKNLPNGYQTKIGPFGSNLSGGQKQRLAIARAILHNAEVLILDEATSALDNISEALVRDAIENLTKNKTCIVIAHRFSTIEKADKIYVMQSGEVVEEGTSHNELLERKKKYYSLFCGTQD